MKMYLFKVWDGGHSVKHITGTDKQVVIDAYLKLFPSAKMIQTEVICERDEIIPTTDPTKEFEADQTQDKYDKMKNDFYDLNSGK